MLAVSVKENGAAAPAAVPVLAAGTEGANDADGSDCLAEAVNEESAGADPAKLLRLLVLPPVLLALLVLAAAGAERVADWSALAPKENAGAVVAAPVPAVAGKVMDGANEKIGAGAAGAEEPVAGLGGAVEDDDDDAAAGTFSPRHRRRTASGTSHAS